MGGQKREVGRASGGCVRGQKGEREKWNFNRWIEFSSTCNRIR